MSDIGNSLREARIRRGLSIKDVADATKIRSKYLEALEEDDFEVLPGPVFAKAFLRTYASFLRLDADELIASYQRGHEGRKDDPVVLRTEAVQQPRSRTTAERRKRRTRRNQRGYALVGVLAVAAVVLLAWFGSGRGQEESVPLDSASFSSTPSSTPSTMGTGEVSTTTTETSSTGGSSTTTTVAMTGENVVLVATVTDGSCWLVVCEDNESGAELFAGTLFAGGQKTFDSAKRYWMNIGAPEVLSVSINGVTHTLDAEGGFFTVTEAGIEPSQ